MVIYGKMAERLRRGVGINFSISVRFDANKSILDSSVKLPTILGHSHGYASSSLLVISYLTLPGVARGGSNPPLVSSFFFPFSLVAAFNL